MKNLVFLIAPLVLVVVTALNCSSPDKPTQSTLFASAGCRGVHSCSSCSSTERCDVTSRDPEGWPTARECCPK